VGGREPGCNSDVIVVAVLSLPLCAVLAALLLLGCGGSSDEDTTSPDDGALPNLLVSHGVSGDFEADTEGWADTAGATVAGSDEAHSGESGLNVEVQGEGTEEGALTSPLDTIQTVPGNRYRASAWVRAPQGVPMELRLSERAVNGNHIKTTADSFSGTGAWHYVEVDAKFGDRGRRATIHVYSRGSRPFSFNLDDVVLSRFE
jgi:hypothetical protein